MAKGPNKILLTGDDLIFVQTRNFSKSFKSVRSSSPQIEKPDLLKASTDPSKSFSNFSDEFGDVSDSARYNGDIVHLKKLNIHNFEVKHKTMHHLKVFRDLRHENLNAFVGCFVDPTNPSIVTEYCSRGSLEDIIHDDNIKLDWSFKLSLLTDLVRGARYLHTTPIKHHGYLKSGNCVIDSRWVLKITDYGLPLIYERYQSKPDYKAKDLLWTAPEHLRDPPNVPFRGSQKGDVYSFGIILQEVIMRGMPFCMLDLEPEEIIRKVRKPPPLCRPSVSQQAAPPQYIQIMKQCWTENPDIRPDFESIYQEFKDLNKGKKMNIVDTMFKMLEKYSNDLEELVKDRTDALAEEKKKTEHLISRMLPPMVAKSLMMGTPVEAESYNEVTIYFSDIVGFTTISAMSNPMQVVALLNELYTMFDSIIEKYEVYKVETIGDAYMVASGLPVRIKHHAQAICLMALDLLSDCAKFKIHHMPEVPLRLRIGLHTGPCVAGVVGLTMPRYCLFGDTVNTASRMESTGAAFRIHISETTRDLLVNQPPGGFHIQYRGEVELKGKGTHKTYWLTGKDGFDKPLPEPPEMSGDNHGILGLLPRNRSFTDAVQTVRNSLRANTSSLGTGSVTAEDKTSDTAAEQNGKCLKKQSSRSCNNMDEIGSTVDFKEEKANERETEEGFEQETNRDVGGLHMREKFGSVKLQRSFDKKQENPARRTSSAPVSNTDQTFCSESQKDKHKAKDSSRPLSGKSQLRSLRKRASERLRKMQSSDDGTTSPETRRTQQTMPKSVNAVNSKSDIVKPVLRKTDSSGSHKGVLDMKNSQRREGSNSFKSNQCRPKHSLNSELKAATSCTIYLEDKNRDSSGKQQPRGSVS
ncbi:retinal guanylyl cyclase 2-like [Lineus longissimus]|uniref:retinal guanylyl cyclase 2-like n=1 Tax=Lineus longissimus TaxID=88925 RepID=UPI00315D3281